MNQLILHSLNMKMGGWTIRIDSPHGDKDYHHKHVHITKKGLNGKYSWNIDGSRHDKHKFPNQEKYINKAIKIAEEALSLQNGTLQLVLIHEGKVRYYVKTLSDSDSNIFRIYIQKNKIIVILMSSKGLVSIIIPKII